MISIIYKRFLPSQKGETWFSFNQSIWSFFHTRTRNENSKHIYVTDVKMSLRSSSSIPSHVVLDSPSALEQLVEEIKFQRSKEMRQSLRADRKCFFIFPSYVIKYWCVWLTYWVLDFRRRSLGPGYNILDRPLCSTFPIPYRPEPWQRRSPFLCTQEAHSRHYKIHSSLWGDCWFSYPIWVMYARILAHSFFPIQSRMIKKRI